MKRMTKTRLAITLSKMEVFESPKAALEQYPTDSEIAAEVLWQAYMLGDIENKSVLDLGCGSGILGLGAALLGASSLTMIDKDTNALELSKINLSKEAFTYFELSLFTNKLVYFMSFDRS